MSSKMCVSDRGTEGQRDRHSKREMGQKHRGSLGVTETQRETERMTDWEQRNKEGKREG